MKRYFIVTIYFLLFPLLCYGEMDSVLEEQYEISGGKRLEQYYSQELKEDLTSLVPEFSIKKTVEQVISGTITITPEGLLHWLGNFLWGGIKSNISAFGILLLLTVLSGITGQLNALGGEKSAAEFICCAVMSAIVIEMFDQGVRQSVSAISSMSEFVTVLTPVMTTLLAGSGHPGEATLLHPVLYSAATFSINAVNRFIAPAIYSCFLLCIANSLSDENKLEGFTALIKNGVRWILTVILTLFSGLTAIYSFSGQNVDIMVSKTARFAVGNLVPIVGGLLSESVELVLSFSSVLRRGIGIGGIVVLLLLFTHTAVQLAVQLWLFRIGSAFASPLGSPVLGKLLSDTAGCIGMLLAALCVCAVLFSLILIMMIDTGGSLL